MPIFFMSVYDLKIIWRVGEKATPNFLGCLLQWGLLSCLHLQVHRICQEAATQAYCWNSSPEKTLSATSTGKGPSSRARKRMGSLPPGMSSPGVGDDWFGLSNCLTWMKCKLYLNSGDSQVTRKCFLDSVHSIGSGTESHPAKVVKDLVQGRLGFFHTF